MQHHKNRRKDLRKIYKERMGNDKGKPIEMSGRKVRGLRQKL